MPPLPALQPEYRADSCGCLGCLILTTKVSAQTRRAWPTKQMRLDVGRAYPSGANRGGPARTQAAQTQDAQAFMRGKGEGRCGVGSGTSWEREFADAMERPRTHRKADGDSRKGVDQVLRARGEACPSRSHNRLSQSPTIGNPST